MISIRQGSKEDLPAILELIKELAAFERAPDQVINTVELMEEDGFGNQAVFGFLVAMDDESIVGTSIYYYRYSTWKGRRLFLEDLIVTEKYRGKGIGSALFEKTIEVAKKTKCTGMMWQVLDWNTPAIDFYKKYNAGINNDWLNCHIDF